jgi:2-succinyl-5-enolpyruvyl-6-hydroxy-3-cyclohexene-1-carboxylate synthase
MHQVIADIAQVCAEQGIEQAVISPGSRSAPLTLAFARHPRMRTWVVPDERAAAFIALGMAQQSQKTVALICTSGSAGLNYAPAVAEAFFRQVPLLIFTADRPPEWIDQLDGQTIRQQNLYGQHAKGAFQLPSDYTLPEHCWHLLRVVNEAALLCRQFPQGPVQVNAPFREPFYPPVGAPTTFSESLKIIRELPPELSLGAQAWAALEQDWAKAERVMVVGGQYRFSTKLQTALSVSGLPVVADVIGNLQAVGQSVRHHDVFLGNHSLAERLSPPDLLITFGQSLISKQLKKYLRQHLPAAHWHIQEAGAVADTFQVLTQIVRCSPEYFFSQLPTFLPQKTHAYFTEWQLADQHFAKTAETFFQQRSANAPLSEAEIVFRLLQSLDNNCVLHLANSMPVRYVNFFGLPAHARQITVWSNRGTSGIDGSVSTALGHALMQPDKTHILLTGDVGFFYDRNALWHSCIPNNLKILLVNNHGGGIFAFIEAGKHPEVQEFFITEQALSAKRTAEDARLHYEYCTHTATFAQQLHTWRISEKAALLEVATTVDGSMAIWQQLKSRL